MNPYNTFNFTDKDFKNENLLLEKLKQLKFSGVNLDLPVIQPKEITLFSDYIISNTSLAFYSKILKENLVRNSYAFKIINGQVIEHKTYNLEWIRNKLFTDKDIALDIVKCLAVDLNKQIASDFVESKTKNIINDIPPLLHVINNLYSKNFVQNDDIKYEIWNIALTYNNELKNYLKDLLDKDFKISFFLGNPFINEKTYFSKLESVLYNHGLIQTYVEQSPMLTKKVLFHSIENNKLDETKRLILIYQKSSLLSSESNHDMLMLARSPEIANILMKNGCSFYNYSTQRNSNKTTVLAINNKMNAETVDVILSFKPSNADVMKDKAGIIFERIFNLSDIDTDTEERFKVMKLLIEDYDFPLENFDMLNVGFSLNKKDTKYSQWFLEHGANKNQCSVFIEQIKSEKNFNSILEQYSKIIDVYGADFCYQMIKNNKFSTNSENYKNYLSKISNDQLISQTSTGEYVWWALPTTSPRFMKLIYHGSDEIKEKLNKSLKSENNSWVGDFIMNNPFDGDLSFFESFKDKLGLGYDDKYPLIINNYAGNNILHHLLTTSTNSTEVNFVLHHTNADIAELLNKPNDNGETPLQTIFLKPAFIKANPFLNTNGSRIYQMTEKFINHLKEDFPFDSLITQDKTALDCIKYFYEEDFNIYMSKFLKNKLDKIILVKDETQTKRIKI